MSSTFKKDLSYERACELLSYDADTGALVWRKTDKSAGYVDSQGYRCICVDYSLYKAHRLAWLLTYREWPTAILDHINGKKDDNRICNLRLSSDSENQLNLQGPHADARVDRLGVTFHHGKYMARLVYRGKTYHLGYFKSKDEAHTAYVLAKEAMCNGNYQQVNAAHVIEI